MLKKRGEFLVLLGLLLAGCSTGTEENTKNTAEMEAATNQEDQNNKEEVLNEPDLDIDSNSKEVSNTAPNEEVEAEEIVEKTFRMNILEFRDAWLQFTDTSSLERINTVTNEEYIEVEDGIIYTADINEYLLIQALLDFQNEEIISIFIEAVPPEESYSDESFDIDIAPAVLMAILQPEITPDERGDIVISNLGWGAQGVNQETLNNEYILNDTTYVTKNMDGLLYFGMLAGNIEEMRQRNN